MRREQRQQEKNLFVRDTVSLPPVTLQPETNLETTLDSYQATNLPNDNE